MHPRAVHRTALVLVPLRSMLGLEDAEVRMLGLYVQGPRDGLVTREGLTLQPQVGACYPLRGNGMGMAGRRKLVTAESR